MGELFEVFIKAKNLFDISNAVSKEKKVSYALRLSQVVAAGLTNPAFSFLALLL